MDVPQKAGGEGGRAQLPPLAEMIRITFPCIKHMDNVMFFRLWQAWTALYKGGLGELL